MPIERAAARLIIGNLLPTGVSKNVIMRAIRAEGHGYRTKLMSRDIDLLAGRYKNEYYVMKLNVNEVVPQYLMNETDLKRAFKYRVHGYGTYENVITGEKTVEKASLYTDYLNKKEGWATDYVESFEEKYKVRDKKIIGFEVGSVDHNEDFGY